MKIDELKKELGNKNFYKLCVYGSLILLTIIAYFIKGSNIEININWELLGFIGVIITIIHTEKSRIKQNKFDYQKEKINEEQIEFKKILKEKIDFLNYITFGNDFVRIDNQNFIEGINKVNTYRYQLMMITDDILWYYDEDGIRNNNELAQLMLMLAECIIFYNSKMEKFCNIILKYGEDDEYIEIQKEQFKVLDELCEYSKLNVPLLYKQAKIVIEERDNLMKDKLD